MKMGLRLIGIVAFAGPPAEVQPFPPVKRVELRGEPLSHASFPRSIVLIALTLSLGHAALGKQIIARFNGPVAGKDPIAHVDVNDFATSPDRLAAAPTNARLGPPGSGFPGDGPQGRALDAGIAEGPPQFLHVPLDKTADFSQGTFEVWVKTAWDWTEPERHSFIDLRMATDSPTTGP